MPVLILGSGRCGTSMLTRMLNICGLYIGQNDEMSIGDSSNPKGYWEHIGLSAIRDKIVHHYGGSDVVPPILPEGWENDEWLLPLEQQANEIFKRLAQSGQEWGWKDPASAWIVSFWKKIVPNLKIVLCYRNPVDVVSSLDQLMTKRQIHLYRHGTNQGYLIWLTINESVLSQTGGNERIVTQYESYFPEYYEELCRILTFLGLPTFGRSSHIERILKAFHDSSLNHHTTSLEDTIVSPNVPEQVKSLYLRMILQPTCRLQRSDLSITEIPDSVRGCTYSTAAEIERLNLHLIARNQELEQILASRPHRAASAVCNILIRTERATRSISDFVNLDVRSLVSLAVHVDKS